MYEPPLYLSDRSVDLLARTAEAVGRWSVLGGKISPQLRRENRIRSVQASLEIEQNSLSIDQQTDQVTDQVKSLLEVLGVGEKLALAELMSRLGLKHRPTFRQNYLAPAMEANLIAMEFPDSPNSPKQRYFRQ